MGWGWVGVTVGMVGWGWGRDREWWVEIISEKRGGQRSQKHLIII